MTRSGDRAPPPARAAAARPPPGTPLYVHVPFCAAKCTYCDFYSLAGEGQDLAGTLELLLAEAAARAPERPRTVYLGGGTPSYYAPEDLERLLDGLERVTRFRSSAVEVTCECNPESLDVAKARLLRQLGVDRLSIGLQSLEPRILELFGRVHDVATGFAAVEAARAAGFERVSVDLIYGVPGQDLARWQADLARVLALRPDHLSAYQLTFEEGTPLWAQLQAGTVSRLSEDEELAFFEATHAQLADAGYEGYEVSNFCLTGQQCLHNVNYWRNGPYLGLGPSAVSKVGHTRLGNPRSLVPWRQAVAAGRPAAAWEETPAPALRLGETWWLGLRTRAGVEPAEACRVAGFEGADPTAAERDALAAVGLLEEQGGRTRLSTRGWPLADAVARRLLGACRAARSTTGGE
ncbi:MAG TPA: radical SAM family heme chaperone HemW [Planctomycetota bacterium]